MIYQKSRCFITIFFLVVLNGCATAPELGDRYPSNDSINPSQDYATLVVYKKGVNIKGRHPGDYVRIEIDGHEEGALIEGGYMIVQLEEGVHKIVASVPFGMRPLSDLALFKDKEIEYTFSAGEVYFINYKVSLGPLVGTYMNVGYAAGTTYSQVFNDISFSVVNKEVANIDLESCSIVKIKSKSETSTN